MSTDQRTLFVYYKLPAAESAAWLPQVQAFCRAVMARWPGVTVELMRRPEVGPDARVTWMEIYRHPQGVPAELVETIDQIAQEHKLPFVRASEIFIPMQAV